MRESLFETLVGFIVVAVAGFFLFISMGQRSEAAPRDSYTLDAVFSSVDGISVGSDVRLAGKKIGVVQAINIDPKTYQALVTLSVPRTMASAGKSEEFLLPDDTTAQIKTDGLLGGAYIGLMVGGSFDYLQPGGRIEYTRGTVDLLTVLSEVASGAMGGDKDEDTASGEEPALEPALEE
jgi:phospholipid/cholesterol/gamma-HCH transport system substrate-binding protein